MRFQTLSTNVIKQKGSFIHTLFLNSFTKAVIGRVIWLLKTLVTMGPTTSEQHLNHLAATIAYKYYFNPS
jgi:hypothetical protein